VQANPGASPGPGKTRGATGNRIGKLVGPMQRAKSGQYAGQPPVSTPSLATFGWWGFRGDGADTHCRDTLLSPRVTLAFSSGGLGLGPMGSKASVPESHRLRQPRTHPP
jgi:hypothetical protein